MSQSQVQVKLEPPEEPGIVALNGDDAAEQSDAVNYEVHYDDSASMNGRRLMEAGASGDELGQR